MTIQEAVKLGDVIRRARLNAGLDQEPLAEKVGVSRATVSNWERGVSEPGVSQLRRIAEATGAEYLYDLRELPSCWMDHFAGQAA